MAKNFKEVVFLENKDFLILFYADYCRFTQEVSSIIYLSLLIFVEKGFRIMGNFIGGLFVDRCRFGGHRVHTERDRGPAY